MPDAGFQRSNAFIRARAGHSDVPAPSSLLISLSFSVHSDSGINKPRRPAKRSDRKSLGRQETARVCKHEKGLFSLNVFSWQCLTRVIAMVPIHKHWTPLVCFAGFWRCHVHPPGTLLCSHPRCYCLQMCVVRHIPKVCAASFLKRGGGRVTCGSTCLDIISASLHTSDFILLRLFLLCFCLQLSRFH